MSIACLYSDYLYKCLLFQFFSRGILVHIPILTGSQNGHITRLKDSVIFAKNILFEASLHDEGHFYANCLFYIRTIYLKCHLFQFFSRDIRIHIVILTGVQNGHTSLRKNSHILLKNV